jgi:hypothetical protein
MRSTQIAVPQSRRSFLLRPSAAYAMVRPARGHTRPSVVAEIVDLIAAAGPLAVGDLAGGIRRPVEAVARRLRGMTARGLLVEDEWGRFRLAPCVDAALA